MRTPAAALPTPFSTNISISKQWQTNRTMDRLYQRLVAFSMNLVLGVGIEPTFPCGRRILSPLRLPISPSEPVVIFAQTLRPLSDIKKPGNAGL